VARTIRSLAATEPLLPRALPETKKGIAAEPAARLRNVLREILAFMIPPVSKNTVVVLNLPQLSNSNGLLRCKCHDTAISSKFNYPAAVRQQEAT
jgi:hypothetical protein